MQQAPLRQKDKDQPQRRTDGARSKPAAGGPYSNFGNQTIQRLMRSSPRRGDAEHERQADKISEQHPLGAVQLYRDRARIHNDTEGSEVAEFFGARAITRGRDIFFARGEYQPHNPTGSRLLAHELTHVAQQNRWPGPDGQLLNPAPATAIQLDPLSLEQIDTLIAENEQQASREGVSTEQLETLHATRERLLQLRSQVEAGGFVDWSLAVSGPTGTALQAPTEQELATFYRQLSAFSSGLEVLGLIINRIRRNVEQETEDWFIFSDREFTRPVVDRIVRNGSSFANRAAAFLDQHLTGYDETMIMQLSGDISGFRDKMRTLQSVAPEHIGAAEATGRRFLGGVTGASGAFLGFLRLGLWDSWGQLFFEGSERRIQEAQDGMYNLMVQISDEGLGETISQHGTAWLQRLEESERLEQYSSSGAQFGSTAFDVYFVGRGLVSAGRGAMQLSRAASAYRAMGVSSPWRMAIGAATREAVTFRGVGVHGGRGFWGSQYRLPTMGETVSVNRVINTEADLTAKFWRGEGRSLLPVEGGEQPSVYQVARQTVSSSQGSPFQPGFPVEDVPTYVLSYQPSASAVSGGGTVVRVRVPVRGLVDKNLLLSQQAGVASAETSAMQRGIFRMRIPEHLRPSATTPEAYMAAADSRAVRAWVRANLEITDPAAARVLEGMQPLEWEQLMMAPSLRPYITEIGPNPVAGSRAGAPLSIRPGRVPSYHPALNPRILSQLARGQAGGWQQFSSYSQWMRGGAGAQLGFTPGEIASAERLAVLGGTPGPTASMFFAPTELPYLPLPTQTMQPDMPQPTADELRGYANWIGDTTGVQSPLLQPGQPPATRGVQPRERGPVETSASISTIAARIRGIGGAVQQLRVSPGIVYLRAIIPANSSTVRNIVNDIVTLWQSMDASQQAGIELMVDSGLSATQSQSFDLSHTLAGITSPDNLQLTVRMRAQEGQ